MTPTYSKPEVDIAPVTSTENSREPAWLASGRVPSLDGLRCVSIILVLIAHMGESGYFHLQAITRRVYEDMGAVGVDVFFVLSGFLITLLLIREHNRTDHISLRAFYARRALRIFPVYVAFLLCVLVLDMLRLLHPSIRDWVGMLTYTANFNNHPAEPRVVHLWSLSLEEHFYLFWPATLLFLGFRRARVALVAIVAATPLVRLVLQHYFRRWLDIDYCTFGRMDTIAVGCLLAFVAQERQFREKASCMLNGSLQIALPVLILVASVWFGEKCGKYFITIGEVVISLAIGMLVWYCASSDGIVSRLLNTRLFIAIGVLSYSIYIWHPLFLGLPIHASWLRVLAYLAVSLAAATASYYLVELPFLRLKGRAIFKQPVRSNLSAPTPDVAPADV